MATCITQKYVRYIHRMPEERTSVGMCVCVIFFSSLLLLGFFQMKIIKKRIKMRKYQHRHHILGAALMLANDEHRCSCCVSRIILPI